MDESQRMHRREAIKWMAAASAALSVADPRSFAATRPSKGYGTDPKVMETYKPGDVWPLTFSAEQQRLVSALCDAIIPADEKSPAASEVHVPEFIDEWLSAPYPIQQKHRKEILGGLTWIEKESRKRFKKGFADLSDGQKEKICDDICHIPKAASSFKKASHFFEQFRDLTTSAFYTSPQGMKDIQYLGNVASTKWDGPPPEVLAYLKLG
jgi:hypothetical protein